MISPVYMTAAELAARWKTSEAALANRRSRGVGPRFIRLGRKHGPIRYPLSEVVRFETLYDR